MPKIGEIAWSRLSAVSQNAEEIFAALNSVASGLSHVDERRVVVGHPPVLEYGWSKAGNPFVRILSDSTSVDSDQIVAHCRVRLSGTTRWATFVMAGRFRTAGSIAIEGLQVRPIDDLRDAGITSLPTNEHSLPHQPSLNAVLVDVEFLGASDPFVDAGRRNRAIQKASNLLTLATWPPLFHPGQGDEAWTLVWDQEAMTTRNARFIPGFHHPEVGDSTDAPATDGNTLPTVEHDRMAAGPLDHLDGQLYLSDSLPKLWAAALDQSTPTASKVNRALAWYAAGLQATDPAIKIPCYVSALESAIPEPAERPCAECGQPRFKLTARVNAFLTTFCEKELRKEFRDSIYRTRSRLAHGLYRYDVDHTLFSALNTRQLDVLKVQTATRAALLNWLLSLSSAP